MKAPHKLSVLFVCMGNICRSPTAEGVFRKRIKDAGLADVIHADSAGTHAYHVGQPPDPRSQKHAAQRGYDLSRLRARKVSTEDFIKFDFVLAMDDDNLEHLKAGCPQQHVHKLKLLMEFARKHKAKIVPDPYYGSPAGFDLVLDYVEDASDGLVEVLRKELVVE